MLITLCVRSGSAVPGRVYLQQNQGASGVAAGTPAFVRGGPRASGDPGPTSFHAFSLVVFSTLDAGVGKR